jgi:Tol biopolymer transport system component
MRVSGFFRFRLTLTGYVLIGLLAGGRAGFAAGGSIELVSRVDPGALSDAGSGSGPILAYPPAISRDGRYVAFLSVANNLVPGQIDRNADGGQRSNDLFLYDRIARTTTLVSHAADSPVTTGDEESLAPAISADGRWIVYSSRATNLVDGLSEFPAQTRLFLWDRISGNTTLVSSSPAIDDSGCYGCGVLASAISGDGRFVAFSSTAPDLVPGQPDGANVFLYARITGKTALVSRLTPASAVTGSTALDFSLSADGRFIAFNRHLASPPGGGQDEGGVFLYDRVSAEVTAVGPGAFPAISADGGSVAFLSAGTQVVPGQIDRNGQGADVFLYSRAARTILLVSHAAGQPKVTGNRASDRPGPGFIPTPFRLSADGRLVVFQSLATDLVPRQVAKPGATLFVFDRATGAVTLVSRAGGSPASPSLWPDEAAISADGRFITFKSFAVDLVPGQRDFNDSPDIFLFDLKSGQTSLVSARSGGGPRNAGSGFSYAPVISADGSTVAFYSSAPDLAAGVRDLNAGDDLIVYDVAQRTATVGSRHAPGMASRSPDADSFLRGLSADGRWVLFEGAAANLAPGQTDLNGQSDVFLYDHATRTVTLVSHAGGAAATAGDGPSWQSTLSADGRFAAFTSDATNLDPTVSDYVDTRTGQHRTDVFLFDRVTGKTLALSRSARHPGVTGDFDSGKPALSADGRWVAFMSFATDLVPAASTATGNVYLYDRVTGALTRTNAGATTRGSARPLTLSADGRYLAVLTPEPSGYDVYLYDRVAGAQTLVSHAPDGTAASDISQDETPALSADGRFVAFVSGRGDLGGTPGGDVNVYLWDRESGAVTLAGASDRLVRGSMPRHPVLSADGRWLAFLSNRSLVPGSDNPSHADQVYLYDRVSGALTLVGFSGGPLAISADGRYVATGLDLYDRLSGAATVLAAVPVYDLLLSADGHSAAFQSPASSLVTGDFNGVRMDVFLFRQAP